MFIRHTRRYKARQLGMGSMPKPWSLRVSWFPTNAATPCRHKSEKSGIQSWKIHELLFSSKVTKRCGASLLFTTVHMPATSAWILFCSSTSQCLLLIKSSQFATYPVSNPPSDSSSLSVVLLAILGMPLTSLLSNEKLPIFLNGDRGLVKPQLESEDAAELHLLPRSFGMGMCISLATLTPMGCIRKLGWVRMVKSSNASSLKATDVGLPLERVHDMAAFQSYTSKCIPVALCLRRYRHIR